MDNIKFDLVGSHLTKPVSRRSLHCGVKVSRSGKSNDYFDLAVAGRIEELKIDTQLADLPHEEDITFMQES